METVFLLAVLVAGMALAIWVVRTYHRPGRAGALRGSSFPPGTRAFEAEMSLGIIASMLADRERELAQGPDDARSADLSRQIANLRKQAEIHRATVEARDLSPGRKRIGVDPDADHVD